MAIIFDISDMPPVGSIVTLDRKAPNGVDREELQTYRLCTRKPHVTKEREMSYVLRWATVCGDCGKEFLFTSGLNTRSFVRRCRKCRQDRPYVSAGWAKGPRNRHTIKRPDDVDPASLF